MMITFLLDNPIKALLPDYEIITLAELFSGVIKLNFLNYILGVLVSFYTNEFIFPEKYVETLISNRKINNRLLFKQHI